MSVYFGRGEVMTKYGRNKDGLTTFTLEHVRSWQPCYDPQRHLKAHKLYTAVDILKDVSIPVEDRIWCVMRTDLASEKLMRLFAVWCVRQVQYLLLDKRSLDALDVAKRFAQGKATQEELDAAWDAARAAARDAAMDAAMDAARVAARAAAWAAAKDAARDAAWDNQIQKAIKMFIAEASCKS